MDFDMIATLYALANKPDAEESKRLEAALYLQKIADEAVASYLALPQNLWGGDARFTSKNRDKGSPMYENYFELYASAAVQCSGTPIRCPEEDDKVGVVLAHRKVLNK